MSSQTRVTDFFGAQKRSEHQLRSANKPFKKSVDIDSATDELKKKTPKRKKGVSSGHTTVHSSAKRKKTPKCQRIIDFLVTADGGKSAAIDATSDPKSPAKAMSAAEVKEKLVNCGNLLALKKQLSQINDCAAKVRQFKEMKVKSPTKKVFRTPTKAARSPTKHSPHRPLMSMMASPLLPPIKSPVSITPNKDSKSALTYRRRLFDVYEDVAESPQKSAADKKDAKKSPAFERFAYLVDKREDNHASGSLVLPQKFKLLAEVFKSMDTVVSMHYKRQEICTFDKLKDSVERMTAKKFDTKRLAQIQTVFGTGFKLKYELFSSYAERRKPSYQLIITPVYDSDVDIRTNSIHLLERYQRFVAKLVDITKDHHKKYLQTLSLNVDDKELVRWHPKFRVDSVPDVTPDDNALPAEPRLGEKTAEEVLANTRQRLGISSTTVTADDDKDNDTNSNDNKTSDTNQKITKGLLKGISMDLLNKIRAKEAANLAKEMTRKPEVETELRILRSLPEFIRIIHSYIVSSKKLAVPYDQLIDKLITSFTSSLSILRAKEHVSYLCRFMPDWICQLEVKKGNYIKINKETTLSALDQRIKTKVNRLKD